MVDPTPPEVIEHTTAEEGVLYATSDLISLPRRYLIMITDFAVLLALGLILAYLADFDTSESFLMAWFGLALVYMVVLKRSRVRTLGYRIVGAKIVNLRGKPPSILRMLFRALLMQIGPANPLFDVLWSGHRDDRTMRDLLSGTYVVDIDAQPARHGRIVYSHMFVFSYSLMYREVQDSTQGYSTSQPVTGPDK